jgi:hypothetical protein
MNCLYCYQACFKRSAWDNHIAWGCEKCRATYFTTTDNQLKSMRLVTTIKDLEYGIYVKPEETTVYSWRNATSPTFEIMTIPYAMSITPDNIQQKLKTLLVFS